MTLIDDADIARNTHAAWEARALAALKGARFDTLRSETLDGLKIEPLYLPADSGARAFRARPGRWDIAQRMDHPDSTQANTLALADLAGGADALILATSEAPSARGRGVAIRELADLLDALAGVHLDLIGLQVDAGAAAPRLARLLMQLARARRLDPAALRIDFGCDPVALLAAGHPRSDIATELAAAARALRSDGFAGATHIADGRVWHNAGASEAQELGLVLASAVESLRLMDGCGLSPDVTASDLCWRMSADADVFLGIAKFRALRLLWARVEATCSLPARAIRLHAESSWRMLTRRDPRVNILRAGAAVFAAGLGGADSVTALPYTSALGLPDAAARRLARNTQLVFLEESHLGHVADPAAGAGGFEALTQQLCEAAWRFFQTLEKAGGLLAAIGKGLPQAAVAEVAGARARAIATRRQPLIGVSEFAAAGEPPFTVLPAVLANPVAPIMAGQRDAEPFEALRDAADAWAARHGARPGVFLAVLGDPAALAPRVNFARGVFEAGGYAVSTSAGGTEHDALVREFASSGARIACLCGSDASAAEHIAGLGAALHGTGAAAVIFAGRRVEGDVLPNAAAIDAFAFEGCDVVELLRLCATRSGMSMGNA